MLREIIGTLFINFYKVGNYYSAENTGSMAPPNLIVIINISLPLYFGKHEGDSFVY